MKKMLLCVAALALLCGCAKTEPEAPEQPQTKALEDITLIIKFVYGGGNGIPYKMEFACQPRLSNYGIRFLMFNMKDVYIDYNYTGWYDDLQWASWLDVTIDGLTNDSETMPVAFRPETYIDKSSLKTVPDISDRYNITYVVEGMPCR